MPTLDLSQVMAFEQNLYFISMAAEMLGMGERTLYRKIKEYDIKE